MSTDAANPGGKMLMAAAAAETKRLLDEAAAEEHEAQLELLEPLSAEEMADAQEDLGKDAGQLAVLRHAREKRKLGRPVGSRNRRTDDTVRYLSQFGPDPAVAMMKIIGDSEEAMVERSRAMDPLKRQLSWGDARNMRIRAAENMMPYFYGKQPVQVDATIRGVMVVEELGGGPRGVTIDQDPLGVMPIDDAEVGE